MACQTLQVINANLDSNATATIVVAATTFTNQAIATFVHQIFWGGATGAERLQIQVGATGTTPTPMTYPVLNRLGEPVTLGSLCQGMRMCFKFVNPTTTPKVLPAHFVMGNRQAPELRIYTGGSTGTTQTQPTTQTQQPSGGSSTPSSGTQSGSGTTQPATGSGGTTQSPGGTTTGTQK